MGMLWLEWTVIAHALPFLLNCCTADTWSDFLHSLNMALLSITCPWHWVPNECFGACGIDYILCFAIFNIFVLCLLSHSHKLFLGPILNSRATGKSLSNLTDSEGSKNCQLSSALTVSSNFEVAFVSFLSFFFFASFIYTKKQLLWK